LFLQTQLYWLRFAGRAGVAALIARLLRKKAAAKVAAKKVGKVRMMTPGEMIRIRFWIPAGTGGEIGFPY